MDVISIIMNDLNLSFVGAKMNVGSKTNLAVD